MFLRTNNYFIISSLLVFVRCYNSFLSLRLDIFARNSKLKMNLRALV